MMKSVDRHEAALMLANHGFENMSEDGVQGDEWRRYGKIRRLELLHRDREEGNNIFEINPTVRIDKYFQVINRSLDQFHEMYRGKEHCNLEEIYVMGHRIQRFLIEFVPGHPEYSKPRSWHLRNQSRREVKTLQFCLEDIAVLIDERLCNQVVDYAPEFDRTLLGEEGSCYDHPTRISFGSSSWDSWVAFGGWQKERDFTQDESLDSTLNTSGSDSIGNFDLPGDEEDEDYGVSAYDQGPPEHESMARTKRVIFPLNLSESAEEDDFLCAIATQKFSFESDSDACDSWAQGHSLQQQKATHGRDTAAVTCDPAEIMFRHALKAGYSRKKFESERLEIGIRGENLLQDVAVIENESRTIEPELKSPLVEDRVVTKACLGESKDNDGRYTKGMRRFVNATQPEQSGDVRTHVKLEDQYLVAAVEQQSELPPVEVGSTRSEKLHFDKFDFNVLTGEEWIDFGDTANEAF